MLDSGIEYLLLGKHDDGDQNKECSPFQELNVRKHDENENKKDGSHPEFTSKARFCFKNRFGKTLGFN